MSCCLRCMVSGFFSPPSGRHRSPSARTTCADSLTDSPTAPVTPARTPTLSDPSRRLPFRTRCLETRLETPAPYPSTISSFFDHADRRSVTSAQRQLRIRCSPILFFFDFFALGSLCISSSSSSSSALWRTIGKKATSS
eukprot:1816054-Prymnesium_polylepis.1